MAPPTKKRGPKSSPVLRAARLAGYSAPRLRDDTAISTIGGNIKTNRIRRAMLAKDLANRVGVTIKAVSHWEAGERCPTALSLWRVARALNVPLEALYQNVVDPLT